MKRLYPIGIILACLIYGAMLCAVVASPALYVAVKIYNKV